jgi:hypothetical protein
MTHEFISIQMYNKLLCYRAEPDNITSVSSPSSRRQNKPSNTLARSRQPTNTSTCCLLHAGSLLGLLFHTETRMFHRNIGCLSPEYTALYPKIQNCSQPPLWEPEIRKSRRSFCEHVTEEGTFNIKFASHSGSSIYLVYLIRVENNI